MSAAEIQPGTRGYAEAGKCCDEAGWRLKTDGTPREPAEACKNHREKHAHPRTGADKPVSATRQGNKDKFAWFYDMLADPTVSIAAKVVGTGCCMKMAGCKGHFKTTRKAVANLCGISQATVRRGLADLIDKRYLDAELIDGAANTYHLIYPAQRYEEWLEAEDEYNCEIERAERQISNWLWAEDKWREQQFRDAVTKASIARGADAARAQRISDHLVAKYRERGVELDVKLALGSVAIAQDEVFTPARPAAETPPSGDLEADQKRAGVGTPESRGRLNVEPGSVRQRAGVGTPESRGRLTPEATTSADDQTHKSFKDSERPLKVFQDLESEPALRDALTGALRTAPPSAGECELCGPDGIFRDPDGYAVVLNIDVDGVLEEYPVVCHHSMAGNLAEIQRREKAEGLALCKTGWPDIDFHYPHLRD